MRRILQVTIQGACPTCGKDITFGDFVGNIKLAQRDGKDPSRHTCVPPAPKRKPGRPDIVIDRREECAAAEEPQKSIVDYGAVETAYFGNLNFGFSDHIADAFSYTLGI